MAGKLYIKTHGCQMNEYDSSKMADVLGAAHGLELTENEAEADVILINTCSIREKAQEKVFSSSAAGASSRKPTATSSSASAAASLRRKAKPSSSVRRSSISCSARRPCTACPR